MKTGVKDMFFGRRKKEYRYYRNGETAFLTEGICDICGKKRKCCDGKSFEQGVQLVCSKCIGKRLASACVPPEIAMQVIGPDANEKIEDLRHTPPIVWLQNNEWPCCCNDFMTYEGIWETYVLHHKELSDCFDPLHEGADHGSRGFLALRIVADVGAGEANTEIHHVQHHFQT